MTHFNFLGFLLFLVACSDHKKQELSTFKAAQIPIEFIDTSYTFADKSKQRIVLSQSFSIDSSFQYLNFKYFRNVSGEWKLVNKFDSIVIWNGFETGHNDFNGDRIPDFVFLAGRGGRGANYFEHLLVFDRSRSEFMYIKGFDEVCAPDFDTIKNLIMGTGASGAYRDIRYYHIKGDSIVLNSVEVWRDDKLIKKSLLSIWLTLSLY